MRIFIWVLVGTAALLSAPLAAAETSPVPAPPSPPPWSSQFPKPTDGSVLVPGMDTSAVAGAQCDGTPVFGLSPEGTALVCVFGFDEARNWEKSVPLVGVRIPESACSLEVGKVAMSPLGEGMMCVPTEVGVTEALVWTPAT